MSLDVERPSGLAVTSLTVTFWCPTHEMPIKGIPTWFPIDAHADSVDETSSTEWDADTSEMHCPKGGVLVLLVEENEQLHFTGCTSSWILLLH